MNRKRFIRIIASVPLLNVPLKSTAWLKVPDACKTQKDVEGPFYKADAPLRSVLDTDGEPLTITGSVFRADDCTSPLAQALLDIWHCDHEGHYDMKGYCGRGCVVTDKNGHYSFTTIFPPPYGSRPRHIHVKVRAEGYPELTTQIYFKGDPNIHNDFARNAEQSRVIELEASKEMKTGVFDIYL
jgi:catechol 1,2-dioxygenase